jgi:hypothetical protein
VQGVTLQIVSRDDVASLGALPLGLAGVYQRAIFQ